MLGKLKAECGAGYTAKLEGMLKDLSLGAGDLNAHWTEVRAQKREPSAWARFRPSQSFFRRPSSPSFR